MMCKTIMYTSTNQCIYALDESHIYYYIYIYKVYIKKKKISQPIVIVLLATIHRYIDR